MTTVNTVPTAATRIGDFSDYRDRNGNLIPIYDPNTTRVDAQGRTVRDQFPNNIIPQDRILSVGRNIASIYPLPNNAQQQFRQLHLHARPRDHRQGVLRPRRPPAVGQRLVVRPLQLRQIQARCAAGPGELLFAHARRGRRALRSRAVRRRHPEHEADDPRRGVQLLEGSQPHPRQRAADWLCQHRALHDPVGLRHQRLHVARHSRHQHQRHHHGPPEHRHHELYRPLRRTGVPARQPQPVPLPGRGRAGVVEGPSPGEVRVSRSSIAGRRRSSTTTRAAGSTSARASSTTP